MNMMYEMINKMMDEIKYEISYCNKEFELHGRSEHYYTGYNRIVGMIKMLSIVTGKNYYFDKDGLHERV